MAPLVNAGDERFGEKKRGVTLERAWRICELLRLDDERRRRRDALCATFWTSPRELTRASGERER